MKIGKRAIEKDGSGMVAMIPEDSEDLWHAYHIIAEGDRVRTTTFRKVQKEGSTGSVSSERVTMNLTIRVEDVFFDPAAGSIQLKGRNVTENQFVKLGQYHTLDLELNRSFSVSKGFWDPIFLERLEIASDVTKKADTAALIMSEGLAHICLITPYMTLLRSKIEVSIPRKRKAGVATHDKSLSKFFESVSASLQQHIDFSVVKVVIVASPGFTKDQFMTYLMEEATRKGTAAILDNRSKFVLAHSSSGHKHALKEVLTDPALGPRLADTKAAAEVRALNEFFDMLNNTPDRAFYGPNHVLAASKQKAIDTLLITDNLFKSSNLATRKRYVKLVENVRENGGQVLIFSSLHVSGEQLTQLTGVAAILRFPLPDIEDIKEEEDKKDSKDKKSKESASSSSSALPSISASDEYDDNSSDDEWDPFASILAAKPKPSVTPQSSAPSSSSSSSSSSAKPGAAASSSSSSNYDDDIDDGFGEYHASSSSASSSIHQREMDEAIDNMF